MPQDTFQTIGEGLLGPIDPEKRERLLGRLGKMIDYAIKRQDWYEDQRSRALSVGVTLLGLASFLVVGLLSATADNMTWFRSFAALTPSANPPYGDEFERIIGVPGTFRKTRAPKHFDSSSEIPTPLTLPRRWR